MNPVIQSISEIHSKRWQTNQSVSKATHTAISITTEWQEQITSSHKHIKKEFPVEGLKEKIDLYDTKKNIAYELKVSQNNTHMEFYRDIFKIIVHNETAAIKIKELVFIAPKRGIQRLQRGLGLAASELGEKLGSKITTYGI